MPPSGWREARGALRAQGRSVPRTPRPSPPLPRASSPATGPSRSSGAAAHSSREQGNVGHRQRAEGLPVIAVCERDEPGLLRPARVPPVLVAELERDLDRGRAVRAERAMAQPPRGEPRQPLGERYGGLVGGGRRASRARASSCAWIAALTRGWPCPSKLTHQELIASRMRRPSSRSARRLARA